MDIDFEIIYILKVFVPLTHDGGKGWIFNLICPGNAMSVSHEKLLLLKNSTFNKNISLDDVCREKQVYVAYNNDPPFFEVSSKTGRMDRYQVPAIVRYRSIAWEWEIQAGIVMGLEN